MSPGERNIILEQALATEDNVRVALLMGMAFDDLRCRIISGFAECVSARLRERFRANASWRVTNEIGLDGYLQRSGAIWAIHRLGKERICVKLMYDRSPERVYYSILNEQLAGSAKINWGSSELSILSS